MSYNVRELAVLAEGLGRRFGKTEALSGLDLALRHIRRIPEKALGALLLPLVFVLLFAYVFGSAIRVPGGGSCR